MGAAAPCVMVCGNPAATKACSRLLRPFLWAGHTQVQNFAAAVHLKAPLSPPTLPLSCFVDQLPAPLPQVGSGKGAPSPLFSLPKDPPSSSPLEPPAPSGLPKDEPGTVGQDKLGNSKDRKSSIEKPVALLPLCVFEVWVGHLHCVHIACAGMGTKG